MRAACVQTRMQGTATAAEAATPRWSTTPRTRWRRAPAAWPQNVSIADTVPMSSDSPADRVAAAVPGDRSADVLIDDSDVVVVVVTGRESGGDTDGDVTLVCLSFMRRCTRDLPHGAHGSMDMIGWGQTNPRATGPVEVVGRQACL